jgi:hypothetical protein
MGEARITQFWMRSLKATLILGGFGIVLGAFLGSFAQGSMLSAPLLSVLGAYDLLRRRSISKQI